MDLYSPSIGFGAGLVSGGGDLGNFCGEGDTDGDLGCLSLASKGVLMETSEEFEYLNEEFGLQVSIDLMKRSLGAQMSGVDAMKETARTLLGASSVIVSLLGALQLVKIQPAAGFYWLYVAGIVLTLVVFAFQMVLTLAVLAPITLKGPIKAEWGLLTTTFVHKKKNEILRELLDVYLSAIEANRATVVGIRNYTRYASWLLLLVVTILLSLSLIPRGA